MTDTKSSETILKDEIQTAKQAVLDGAKATNTEFKNSNIMETKGDRSGIPDNNRTRRLKHRHLRDLDGLVSRFLEFRSEQDDPDGQEVADKLDALYISWRTKCHFFNRRPRNEFSLRYDAFQDRVKYFLDVEAGQIKAATDAYKENKYQRYVRLYAKELKWRIRWYKVKSFFMKATAKELLFNWWDRTQCSIKV